MFEHLDPAVNQLISCFTQAILNRVYVSYKQNSLD